MCRKHRNLRTSAASACTRNLPDAGSFSCSNDLFNRIQKITRNTFTNNVVSVQSDCPHRERFGYGGDIAVTSEAFLMNLRHGRILRQDRARLRRCRTPGRQFHRHRALRRRAVLRRRLGDGASASVGAALSALRRQKAHRGTTPRRDPLVRPGGLQARERPRRQRSRRPRGDAENRRSGDHHADVHRHRPSHGAAFARHRRRKGRPTFRRHGGRIRRRVGEGIH